MQNVKGKRRTAIRPPPDSPAKSPWYNRFMQYQSPPNLHPRPSQANAHWHWFGLLLTTRGFMRRQPHTR